jgi:HPt (histidine-containing phosphotransfer) domain-containing protein
MASKPATSPKPPRGARAPSPSGTAFCRREGCAWGFAGLWSASMSVSPLFARRRRWTASPRSDVALALVLGVLCLQSAFGADGLERPGWAVVLLIELSVLPLAVRPSHPLAVLATTLAVAIVGDLWFAGFLLPGPVIALYTGGAHRERRIALAAGGATGVALVIAAVAGKGVSTAGFAVAMYAVFAVAWALGDNLRTHRAYLVEVEARAERLERLVAEDNEVNRSSRFLCSRKDGLSGGRRRQWVRGPGGSRAQALRHRPHGRGDAVMDGLEASRRIHREWTGTDRPRIIAMTANAMQGDRDTCLNAGMDDYLSEPIHADELAAALGRAIPHSAVQEMRDTDVLDDSALEHLDVATGDPAFVADLVDTFLREAPVLVAGLKTARQSGDAEEVRRAAHTLKSNARTFGAAGLANLRQELENTAKRQVMSEAAGLVTNIEDEYARVASALATAREERRRA